MVPIMKLVVKPRTDSLHFLTILFQISHFQLNGGTYTHNCSHTVMTVSFERSLSGVEILIQLVSVSVTEVLRGGGGKGRWNSEWQGAQHGVGPARGGGARQGGGCVSGRRSKFSFDFPTFLPFPLPLCFSSPLSLVCFMFPYVSK
jgi:hypothetical protein